MEHKKRRNTQVVQKKYKSTCWYYFDFTEKRKYGPKVAINTSSWLARIASHLPSIGAELENVRNKKGQKENTKYRATRKICVCLPFATGNQHTREREKGKKEKLDYCSDMLTVTSSSRMSTYGWMNMKRKKLQYNAKEKCFDFLFCRF